MTNDDFPAGPIVLRAPVEGLALRAMSGVERISAPFRYELELLSDDAELRSSDLLGKPIGVSLQAPHAEEPRHFHGVIVGVDLIGSTERATAYQVTVCPWIWVLSRRINCRIFQHQSIPDIAKAIFREHGFADFEELLVDSYPSLEYVVQYRETDLAFVSRLLETVGIYYYFRHDTDAHTLVLLDNRGAHTNNPGCEKLPYLPPDARREALDDFVDAWQSSRTLRPGALCLIDYNYEKSLAYMQVDARAAEPHLYGDLESFDYPGGYLDAAAGKKVVRTNLDEVVTKHQHMSGSTNARGLLVGRRFELTEHPVAEYNREYWVTAAQFQLHVPESRSTGDRSGEEVYRCSFTAIDHEQEYRPPQVTPKAVVRGPQTATVAGDPGDEILTDQFGRVKVKFHWDRGGDADSHCSCWVRVSQVWAGNELGAIHIPRVGEEVVVDFLEGDPDRPIIVGRVYNDMNGPPYPLPANKTQSGIKTRSTPNGTPDNFNEVRFEDKMGQELFSAQAEKDMRILVKNDQDIHVCGNRTANIDKDDTTTILGARTATISKDDSTTVLGTRTTAITKNDSTVITGCKDVKITGTDTIVAGGAISISGPSLSLALGGACVSTQKSATMTVSRSRTTHVGGADKLSIAGARTDTVEKEYHLTVKEKWIVDVDEEVSLTSGDASIVLKKNGDIQLKGKNITIQGDSVTLNASKSLVAKGSKISNN